MYIKLFTSGDSKLIDNTDIEKQEIQNTISVIFTFLLGAILLLFFLNIKLPSNTKSYEVVLEENNVKKIVVVDYKDFYILMDIKEIKKVKLENNEEGNDLVNIVGDIVGEVETMERNILMLESYRLSF